MDMIKFDKDRVRAADTVQVGHCGQQDCKCGQITLCLLDEDGNVFAAASMPAATALDIARDLMGSVKAVSGTEGMG